jgi:hypothetical protein
VPRYRYPKNGPRDFHACRKPVNFGPQIAQRFENYRFRRKIKSETRAMQLLLEFALDHFDTVDGVKTSSHS